MAIDGFYYKAFSFDLLNQMKNIMPEDLNREQNQYLIETFKNFTFLSGEALYNDESIELDCEQATLITQIVAEWTFHKIVDLCRSDIPKEYWDSIMQKIAFVVFEVTKQGLIKNIEQEELLQAVEHNVIKTWKDCINELLYKSVLSESEAERAKNISNIDDMAKEANQDASEEKYILKFFNNEKIQQLERIYKNSPDVEQKIFNIRIDKSLLNKKTASIISYCAKILAYCVVYTLFYHIIN